MRIAITAQAPDLNAEVDPRFGRAACFIVADTEEEGFEAVDNSMNLNAAQGAGVQAGRKVAELGVSAVLTGHVGPRAFATLETAGVAVYTGASGTVAQAIEEFKAGKLERQNAADVEGHWV